MKTLSIIPVKDLDQTKTRLGSILDLRKRQVLTLEILYRTLQILRSSEEIEKILVLTPDPRVLAFAEELGVMGLKEKGRGLNEALKQATQWSIHYHYEALLIIPSDIPFLQKDDIEAMIWAGLEEERIVVIAPNEERSGTNALLVKPPGILKYCFGFDSFSRHQNQTFTRHFKVKVYSSTSIGFDLDYPEQYQFLLEKEHSLGKGNPHEDKARLFDSDPWNTLHPARR